MADPSDSKAITDIERFTGMAVQPCLARQRDIVENISRHVPFSLRDYFNPSNAPNYACVASLMAIILVAVVSVFTYHFYTETKYGTITRTNESIIPKSCNRLSTEKGRPAGPPVLKTDTEARRQAIFSAGVVVLR
jgi:hypothetical protein